MARTRIRLKTDGTLARPTIGDSGQLTVPAGSTVKCALFKRKLQQVVGNTGEVHQVTAIAFVGPTVDVERRDQLTVGSDTFVVLEVTPADDDQGVTDHIGLQLGDKV